MITLKYGNTNTYLLNINNGYLLFDTDYAGTLNAFYKVIKQYNIKVSDIKYVVCSHYHPDHCGIVGNLMNDGVKLLLIENQLNYVNFFDYIFKREKQAYLEIDKKQAIIINNNDTRNFLKSIGIDGEIINTNSHSEDGIALCMDDGSAFVGDINPYQYIDTFEDKEKLKNDWDKISSMNPKVIYFAHRPEIKM